MSKCHICGKGPPEDAIAVFRQNATGQPGIWACRLHATAAIDPDVNQIVRVIETDNQRSRP